MDMADVDAADQEGVRNQRAVTAPLDGFGAHDRCGLLLSRLDELFQRLLEFNGLHVIGVAAEGGVAPALVARIRPGLAQASQTRHVLIGYARRLEARRQVGAVELRVMARPWDGANVDEPADAVRLKNCDEFFNGTSRVSDGVEDHPPIRRQYRTRTTDAA